jgi:hypothetical protein
LILGYAQGDGSVFVYCRFKGGERHLWVATTQVWEFRLLYPSAAEPIQTNKRGESEMNNSIMTRMRTALTVLALILVLALTVIGTVSAATTPGSLTFSNTPLLRPEGGDEPAIAIATNGTMAVTALQPLLSSPYGTHLWTGPFGSTPTFRGVLDAALQKPGSTVLGGGDADVDLGSTGTLHATSLVFSINAATNNGQVDEAAETCPNGTSATLTVAGCTAQLIAIARTDRPWITSDGTHVWISYHAAFPSGLIQVQRSDDDGLTWKKVGDPIVGQDGITANSTFNNIQGPLVADPLTHNVYDIYAAGETGFLKGRTFTPNHIYVSRSTDGGNSWTANLAFQAAPGTSLAHFFPALAVDPTNGKLYAVWSDASTVWFSASSDQGSHWTSAVAVNLAPASTAVFAWVAAYNGQVDVVYYGTTAASKDDPSAVWNVYLAQTTNDGASFGQSKVSNTPNHVGVISTNGFGSAPGTRNLLDLFKVAIDPQSGRAAVIYVDDTLTTVSSLVQTVFFLNLCLPGQTVCLLPQVVLAQQQ